MRNVAFMQGKQYICNKAKITSFWMADTDIVEILQSQRENKTRANTAIKKLSRGNHQVILNFLVPQSFN